MYKIGQFISSHNLSPGLVLDRFYFSFIVFLNYKKRVEKIITLRYDRLTLKNTILR